MRDWIVFIFSGGREMVKFAPLRTQPRISLMLGGRFHGYHGALPVRSVAGVLLLHYPYTQ